MKPVEGGSTGPGTHYLNRNIAEYSDLSASAQGESIAPTMTAHDFRVSQYSFDLTALKPAYAARLCAQVDEMCEAYSKHCAAAQAAEIDGLRSELAQAESTCIYNGKRRVELQERAEAAETLVGELRTALNRMLVSFAGEDEELCMECGEKQGTGPTCDTCYVIGEAIKAVARTLKKEDGK